MVLQASTPLPHAVSSISGTVNTTFADDADHQRFQQFASTVQWQSARSARSASGLTPEHLMDYAQATTAPLPVVTA
jgi:hypothetical protein